MSSIWKKPLYSPRQQELKWLNLMWESHDQFCSCSDPPLHLLVLINKDSKAPKPVEDIKNLKCLLTGKDTGTDHTGIDGLEDGELEKLFAEEEEENATG